MLRRTLIILAILCPALVPMHAKAQLTYQAEQILRLAQLPASSTTSIPAAAFRSETTGIGAEALVASSDRAAKRAAREWHLDLGVRFGHTKLGSTKQQLDRRLNLPLKLDVLDFFDSPHTIMDSKSDLSLNTLYAGIGREQNDWLAWTVYFGGGYGKDHSHQRTLNVNLTTEFEYLTMYTGVTFELYPWGLPDYERHASWEERLLASRPYVLTGGEIGYVSAGGRGDYSIAPLKIYEDSVEVRDWLFSMLIGLGWGIPINENWSFNLAVDYAYHLYRPEEYNSWNLISAFRHRF